MRCTYSLRALSSTERTPGVIQLLSDVSDRIVRVEIIMQYFPSDVGFTNIFVQSMGQSGAKT